MDQKYDRLTAFLRAYDLRVEIANAGQASTDFHFAIAIDAATQQAIRIDLATRGPAVTASPGVTARVLFGGAANPLVAALPTQMSIPLDEDPKLRGIANLFVEEAQRRSCGCAAVQARLGEVIVVLAIRRAIDLGAVGAGLLAGLAHPNLHRSLVAMHDDPGRRWRVSDLADLAGMSRGYFIGQFGAIVGQPPAAYLTAWRLTLGRQALLSGQGVKTVAHDVGFGSAAAFSRAFSRHFGHAPGHARPA